MKDMPSEFVRVCSNPFSRVYKYYSSKKDSIYFKFFLYPETYVIENTDLSPVFNRDRIGASVCYEQAFRRKHNLKKYLYSESVIVQDLNLLITRNPNNGEINLQAALLKRMRQDIWMKHVKMLTADLLDSRLLCTGTNNGYNNRNILIAKMEQQVERPLQSHFSHERVREVMNRMGKFQYMNHGDLQPKNLLYTHSGIKIIDFEEGFIGPLGWDIGFLWGNILYLSVLSHSNFRTSWDTWNEILQTVKTSQLRFNVIVFTISSLLMRIHHYPLIRLTKSQKHELLVAAEGMNQLFTI